QVSSQQTDTWVLPEQEKKTEVKRRRNIRRPLLFRAFPVYLFREKMVTIFLLLQDKKVEAIQYRSYSSRMMGQRPAKNC
ncbi:MAG: hypothetical protein KDD06_03915, partial [Phaeodactylibacter sp.]|nr:hypothetical protein [Phaeodactylibacter sp.]